MKEQYYIRVAGDVVDYLVAQGLEADDIQKVIKYLPKHVIALKNQDRNEKDSTLPDSLPIVMN